MHITNNYSNIAILDKVIAKIKWCSFLASQCRFRDIAEILSFGFSCRVLNNSHLLDDAKVVRH